MRKFKPRLFIELNNWYVRDLGIFKLFGFQKMTYENTSWYCLELYLLRVGIEIWRPKHEAI